MLLLGRSDFVLLSVLDAVHLDRDGGGGHSARVPTPGRSAFGYLPMIGRLQTSSEMARKAGVLFAGPVRDPFAAAWAGTGGGEGTGSHAWCGEGFRVGMS